MKEQKEKMSMEGREEIEKVGKRRMKKETSMMRMRRMDDEEKEKEVIE